MLLKVTRDYKVLKAAEGIDWELVQSKYNDTCKHMMDELPDTPDKAKELNEDYPHKKGELTKQVVTTKLKAVRTKYRQAVNSGHKSGHGRIVFIYLDLCEIYRVGHWPQNRCQQDLKLSSQRLISGINQLQQY